MSRHIRINWTEIMNPWQDKCDFGVVHPLIFLACRAGEGPVLETLQAIVDDDAFGAVEICPPKDPAVRAEARDLLSAAQLQVVYLPILPQLIEDYPVASTDPVARRAALDKTKILLDQAIDFGAPLAMVISPRDPGPGERAAATARLAEDLRSLCDYADARSTRRRLHITLENFDREVEKKRLIGPTVEAAALADAVDRPNFGLTIDLSHLPLLDESPGHALRAAGRHLIHAHIGNCVRDYPDSPIYGDFHPRFGHPEGRNDLPEVIEFIGQLNAVGYWAQARARLGGAPILSMEIRTSDESSAVALANGKRTFMRAWSLQVE
jgi:sugar phosphate isomerase/epimerase